MRRNRLLHLLLLVAVDLAHAAGAPRGLAGELQTQMLEGACPRFLLPHECHHLRSRLQQAPPAEREAILADYRMILHEREQACRCELEAKPPVHLPER